ncbi:peptidase U62 modulator of DNA gyrase [Thalassoporum mexicanum PCC 7367]|uniref:TldD/PmbA family protein n=1 Tax=Thalassoporum mexicanum TaxID=3457544 RepID=UPI00029FC243|nr:TldD/PmbA family protein [Pseudanabaena sp. PCC 7367]AFY71467.1 peptidase U62 modulator of DNA gyrase [Pseudanabaena sp. PCC 7367]
MTATSYSLTQLPEKTIELAIAHGATAAEVYVSNSQSHPVYFEANRLKQLESTDSQGLALRLWKDGKPGLATAFGAFEPLALVEQAIAISQLNDPREVELCSQNPLASDSPSYGNDVPVEQLLAWGKDTIAQVRAAYPEAICAGEWDCSSEYTRIVNSLGLDCSYTDRTLDSYVSAELIRGDDFLNVWYAQSQRDRLEPEAIIQPVLQRLQWAQENVAAPSGKVPVLFTSKAADTLLGTISAAMNGKQVEQKSTPWIDRLGEQVIAAELTLAQQPDFGVYSAPFDDEGTATESFTWIDRGVLKGFYADRQTAREIGTTSRGNGFRSGLGSYPSPGLLNLVASPGQGSLADLIAQIDDGIMIDQILGYPPGLSGDFSVNIELGYRIKNGVVVGRLKDTMVAGNAYNALNHLIALGADNAWQGSLYMPSLVVDSLAVTSKSD